MEINSSAQYQLSIDNSDCNISISNHSEDVNGIPSNKEALDITRFVVQRVLVPIVTSVGFFGNIISIRVLTHRSMVSSTNCYLTALSIFDLLYLILSFTLSLKHYEHVNVQDVYHYWYYYGKTLTDICSNVSVCLTVTFSLERLIAVCYPMKGRALCTPQRARIITAVVVILTIACTTPEFFEARLVEVIEMNETKYEFEETEMFLSEAYQVGYYNFLVFTFTVLPLVLLSTFNGILVKAVVSATRIRKQMTYTSMKQDRSRRQKEQNRITIMLIGVVIVFLICQFPNAALISYHIYLNKTSTKLTPTGRNYLLIAGNIVNILVLINSSINFILYSVMSTKFRRVCLIILCNCGKRSKDTVTKTETSLYNGNVPLHFRSRRCNNREQRIGREQTHDQSRRSVRFRDETRNGQFAINFDRRDGRLELNVTPYDKQNNEGHAFTPICIRRHYKCRQNCLQIGQGCVRPSYGQREPKTWEKDSEKSEKEGTSDMFEIKLLLRNGASILQNGNRLDTVL
ncbi:FMRFamide peptide receptor frpr-18-like [Ruditapes philippinarum]|uniref:FMRFamide peptide receptor frpr-18-like n=1 Tax=Ruditapes philippinarum TaxID=129788 RepID=UPI00295B0046|nr:FMRFamide peptide receptor frpr-18-like [Ruditapes philippinarum]